MRPAELDELMDELGDKHNISLAGSWCDNANISIKYNKAIDTEDNIISIYLQVADYFKDAPKDIVKELCEITLAGTLLKIHPEYSKKLNDYLFGDFLTEENVDRYIIRHDLNRDDTDNLYQSARRLRRAGLLNECIPELTYMNNYESSYVDLSALMNIAMFPKEINGLQEAERDYVVFIGIDLLNETRKLRDTTVNISTIKPKIVRSCRERFVGMKYDVDTDGGNSIIDLSELEKKYFGVDINGRS